VFGPSTSSAHMLTVRRKVVCLPAAPQRVAQVFVHVLFFAHVVHSRLAVSWLTRACTHSFGCIITAVYTRMLAAGVCGCAGLLPDQD
jgi:hypothetical protein